MKTHYEIPPGAYGSTADDREAHTLVADIAYIRGTLAQAADDWHLRGPLTRILNHLDAAEAGR